MQDFPASLFRQARTVEELISAKDLLRESSELLGVEPPIRRVAQERVGLIDALLQAGEWALHLVEAPYPVYLGLPRGEGQVLATQAQ